MWQSSSSQVPPSGARPGFPFWPVGRTRDFAVGRERPGAGRPAGHPGERGRRRPSADTPRASSRRRCGRSRHRRCGRYGGLQWCWLLRKSLLPTTGRGTSLTGLMKPPIAPDGRITTRRPGSIWTTMVTGVPADKYGYRYDCAPGPRVGAFASQPWTNAPTCRPWGLLCAPAARPQWCLMRPRRC